MDVRFVRDVLSAAAAGSAVLLGTLPVNAGNICPDQPTRPHVSAADAPNWGYHPTCWQRFPHVPPCDGASGCGMGLLTPDSSMSFSPGGLIYTPQSGLVLPPDQMIPEYSRQAMPAPVTSSHRYTPGSESYSVPPLMPAPASGGLGLPQPPALTPMSPLQAMPPLNVPPIPAPMSTPAVTAPVNSPGGSEVRTFQAMPMPPQPGAAGPSVPGQSSTLPDRLMIRPDGRVSAVPVSTTSMSRTRPGTTSRYGAATQSISLSAPAVRIPDAGSPSASRYGSSATGMPGTAGFIPGQTSAQHPATVRQPARTSARYGR